ncbi:MAG: hypothetical protein UR12_C0011G0007 [candidate division TM6 bacterium GW2011_GWF2_30_66]|nr:MAG: hypothetical protein UR12_C0011G0007 [candidate division TM6 bacterium GW2011_GWF2_30_66]
MKKILQGILALTLLTSFAAYSDCGSCGTCSNGCSTSCCDDDCCGNCCLGPCDGYPYLGYRSQSFNAARRIVGTQNTINQFGKDTTYGNFSLALEYTKSFRSEKLAKYLFGCDLDCTNTLYVQGSDVANRNPKSWLADYIGLSQDFNSQVKFCPRIQNVLVDMDLHLGLDGWAKGLFFEIYSPLTWTKWELNMQECIKDDGAAGFAAGYMAPTAVTRATLANSFQEAMSGSTVFGDMKEAIKFGRMTNCPLTKVALADIRMNLGWNFVLKEDYHFGLFLQLAAPTGNRPSSCSLFEPVVGNGHHWELGAGMTGAWTFWRSKEYDDRNWGIWLDATLTHMFKDCQCRSFDFCGKPGSRYMLLEQMGTNDQDINALVDNTKTVAEYQYSKNLIPAINWSTFQVDVSVGVQADVALKLGYNRENWSFDLGYNLWARSGEKVCQDCDCDCNSCCSSCTTCTTSCNQYAMKGQSFIYGYEASTTTPAYALSATQSTADIHFTNQTAAQEALNLKVCQNPKIDNAYAARTVATALDCYNSTDITRTSIQPVLVSKCLLNMSKSPSAITNKIFGHINYEWKDRNDDWIPFLGIGAEVEFAVGNSCCDDNCGSCCNSCGNTTCSTPCLTSCNSACNSCNSCDDCCCTSKRAGVSQWGLWLKGGVAFN